MLGTQVAEYLGDINKGKESTALAQHIKENGHIVNFNKLKIFDK